MGTLKSSLSSGLAKGQKAAEKQKRKGQQTAGGGKKSPAAYSAAPAKRQSEETENVKSAPTPVYTAAKKSSSADTPLPSGSHYSSSGSRHGGSHGSLGEVSVYEQRRQQRDAARKDFWNHTLDLLGTASAQAGRGITGISVPVEQQLEESRRQIENINATKESRKRLQQLHELGYVPPRYEDLTTAQNAVDRFLGDRTQITGEKTNWGKLIQGVLYKGSDQAVTSIANAADMLFGGLSEELHTLGVESINAALDMVNVIPGVALDYVEPLKEGSALRWSAQKLRDLQQQNQAYFAPNANSSRAAQIIDRFGTSFVAALPMALEAYLLAPAAAGQGMTTQGLNYLSGVSRASGLNALGQMGAEGSRKLLSDPQFWTSYVHAAGGSYQNALEDGISEDDAALYALINGYYNALIEIGGADASLGGINRLPGRLRNIVQRGNESVAVQWLKSILGEMDEEIGQGIIGRGLKAFAGKSVPLVSLDPADHDAIFNPYAALEEGVGGGVNAFLLGSLQSGAALTGQSVSQPSNAPAQQAVYSVNEADYLDLLERKGLLPPESNKNAAHEGAAEEEQVVAAQRHLQPESSGLQSGSERGIIQEDNKQRISRVHQRQSILKNYAVYDPSSRSDAEKLAQANPNYTLGREWQTNCQRCVVAEELIIRGYDVTSKPFNANDSIGLSGIAAWDFDPGNYSKDMGFIIVPQKADLEATVSQAFDSWGENARAIIRVEWASTGEGHFFMALCSDGKITYLDPQTNKIRDIRETVNACTNARGRLWIMRIDNRDFTDAIADAVQNRSD